MLLKLKRLPLRALAFACAFSVFAPMVAPAAASEVDDAARVIAGFPAAQSRLGRTDDTFWKTYGSEVAAFWSEYERRIGLPMQQWSCQEIGSARGGTVFYPFAGPDLPTAYQLFPDADRYVLVSMQKGQPPLRLDKLSKGQLDDYMDAFRRAWKFYGTLGFFRTDDLDGRGKMEGRPVGVTGALMAFAVRLGFEIESIEPIALELNNDEIVPRALTPERPETWESVRMTLRKDGRTVFVDHVRVDLSNASLGRSDGPRDWLERMALNPTLIKAASHLPQEANFSIFRDLVLANAPVVVQDETGIDYADLSRDFNVRLYGKFTRPNTSFDQNLQRSLAAAYQKAAVKPLPFRAGYEKDSGAALQVAVRNTAQPLEPRRCVFESSARARPRR
jgi:hypothetical protein